MSRIRSKGSRCERALRAALVRSGTRDFRMQYGIFGKPDFAFPNQKVAVFCDSDFWHGRKRVPSTNRSYWTLKLARNRKRDKQVNLHLRGRGWIVVRLSESEILRSPSACVKVILMQLDQ